MEMTCFFQNKKQKTSDDFEGNSSSIVILSDNLNETQVGFCVIDFFAHDHDHDHE